MGVSVWQGLASSSAADDASNDDDARIGDLGLKMYRRLRHAGEDSDEKEAKENFDATYGRLSFGGANATAKYACVPMSVDTHRLDQLLFDGWHLSRPSLILSIAGADETDAFQLDAAVEAACAHGLGAVLRSADALLISGGLDTGASSVVGKAMSTLGPRTASAQAARSTLLAVSPLPSIKYHERFLPDFELDGSFTPHALDKWKLEAVDSGFVLVDPNRTHREFASCRQVLNALADSSHPATRASAAKLQREDAEWKVTGAAGECGWPSNAAAADCCCCCYHCLLLLLLCCCR